MIIAIIAIIIYICHSHNHCYMIGYIIRAVRIAANAVEFPQLALEIHVA